MADANGQRFWLLSSPQDWTARAAAEDRPAPTYDAKRRSFSLGHHARGSFVEAPADAELRWGSAPTVRDQHGTFAFVDAGSGEVHGAGSVAGSALIHTPSSPPADMAVGATGALYLVEGNEVVWVDLRARWDSQRVAAPGFEPARIDAGDNAGVWVLDRQNRQVARALGVPLPRRGLRERSGDVFAPHEENPDPPRLAVLPLSFANDETPIDIAIARDGRVAVLLWRGVDEAIVRFVADDASLGAAHQLADIARPFALRWFDEQSWVVLIATAGAGSHVLRYSGESSETDVVRAPMGGVFPLPDHDGAAWVRSPDAPPYYALSPAADGSMPAPRKLVGVSAEFRAERGILATPDDRPLDAGRVGFVWHRIQLEAHIPVGCGLRVFAAASDELSGLPEEASEAWFEHVFGDLERGAGVPCGVWSSQPSELPFNAGVLQCPSEPGRSGLFSVLVQRSGRRVRALAGRYLWLRAELIGTGRDSPEVAALRVYGSRFSYVQRYLPRIFHESLLPPEADASIELTGPSAADFLERFVCNFEGVLTPLEDRIAHAHLLTDPQSAPPEALEWLGSWVGMVFDAAYPEAHRREALARAMLLHRWRGTLRGLQTALDILTGGRMLDGEMLGGAVTDGRIILLEGWRLRRTFATLLGVDLSHADDPLLAGVTRSGNSIVGDALILGDEHRLEFLALMRRVMPPDGPPEGASLQAWVAWWIENLVEHAVVEPFFDALAYRLVVLVHEDIDGSTRGLIERVVELEAPAHLEVEVSRAQHPFMVGLASLVGIDSYLRAERGPSNIVVDQARIGGGGFSLRPAALDPRLEGGR